MAYLARADELHLNDRWRRLSLALLGRQAGSCTRALSAAKRMYFLNDKGINSNTSVVRFAFCLAASDLLRYRLAGAAPDLIFERNQGRCWQDLRRLRSLCAINDKTGDVDFSVRIVRITFAISAE